MTPIEAMARAMAPLLWGNNRGGGLWKPEFWAQQKELFEKHGATTGFFYVECMDLARAATFALSECKLPIHMKMEAVADAAGEIGYGMPVTRHQADQAERLFQAMLRSIAATDELRSQSQLEEAEQSGADEVDAES